MKNRLIRIFLPAIILLSLAGCSGIANTFDELGRRMPTHNDVWCEGAFCWNNTTTKGQALSGGPQGQTGQPTGEYRYSPTSNNSHPDYAGPKQPTAGSPAFLNQGQPSAPVPRQQFSPPPGNPFASQNIKPGEPLPTDAGFGPPQIPPPGENPPTQGGPMPWAPPPQDKKAWGNNVPQGLDVNNPPPGAVPGVNWPPQLPEEQDEYFGPDPIDTTPLN